MERIKTHRLLHVLALFLLSGIFYCCTDERDRYEVPSGGQEKNVTFSLMVPGTGAPRTPETYALTANDENEVKQIAVLLFDGNGNYMHYPIYSNSISNDSGDNTKKTFTVKVPEGTYDMAILANTNTSLGTALSSIHVGDPKASVISKLLLVNANKWDTDNSSGNYKYIPMWGEITGITVSSSMPSSTPVTLSRMVSKIDINLATMVAQNSFDLKSVRLYNYNDRGQVAPDAANWNSATNIVAAPSIPSTAQKLGNPTANPATQPLLYDGTAITKDPVASVRGISCSNEIYTFEAAAGSEADHLINTCLVIGGRYTDDTQDSYYRIDLANTNGTTTSYLPLLRNHQYKININKISGRGLATPEDAFKARPVNIEASIVRWNDGRFKDFVVNDQYLVGVSQAELTFSQEARDNNSKDNTLSVITDYPDGWKIEKIVDENGDPSGASWLTCSVMQGSNPSGDDIKLRMTANNSGNSRMALIHIKAERLVYIVKVNQLITANIGISITNVSGKEASILEFVSKLQDVTDNIQPSAQQFKISWAPVVSDLFFSSNTFGSNAFMFDSGTGLDHIPGSGSLAGSSGPKTYTVRPPVITTANLNTNPFYERSSIILYQVSDGGISTFTKTLTLRQYVYNMVPVVESVYLMDGGNKASGTQKSFSVRSNSPFTVTVKIDPNNIISGLTTSGLANTSNSGTPVYFNIIDDLSNPSLFQKEVTVTIKSPLNLFPDKDIPLNCVSGIIQLKSNSYMVAPNGLPILIPVSRANESLLGTQLGTHEAFTAGLVWTDNANKIASNSNIKMVKATGRGTTGYVLVMPGSASGNAVVCMKNSSDKILWSWHIWVTSYIPSPVGAANFMDRNLGALSNAITSNVNDISAKGLLYQWGRKDAFPGSSTLNGSTELPIYDAVGSTVILKAEAPSSSAPAYNIGNAVVNPTTVYYGKGANNYDWYSNSWVHNDALWGNATIKSVYDPCPEGWRVPQNGAWGNTSVLIGTNGTSSVAHGGITTSNNSVFYPASGYRSSSSNGNLSSVGMSGYLWSRTPINNGSYCFYFHVYIYPNETSGRASAFSVRCVKE